MIYAIIKFFVGIYIRVFYRFQAVGVENVPAEGAVILCANHLSANDPIPVAVPLKRNVDFMAKKELFANGFLIWLGGKLNAFPVDRSKNDMKAIKTALKKLKDGRVLGIFAQGTRVNEGDAGAAKGGVALLAMKSGAPVVPVHIVGPYQFGKPLKVMFGKPISLAEYEGQRLSTEVLSEIAEKIMAEVSALGA